MVAQCGPISSCNTCNKDKEVCPVTEFGEADRKMLFLYDIVPAA